MAGHVEIRDVGGCHVHQRAPFPKALAVVIQPKAASKPRRQVNARYDPAFKPHVRVRRPGQVAERGCQRTDYFVS